MKRKMIFAIGLIGVIALSVISVTLKDNASSNLSELFTAGDIEAMARGESDTDSEGKLICYTSFKDKDHGTSTVKDCGTCMDVDCSSYSDKDKCKQ